MLAHVLPEVSAWSVNLDLSDVRVAAILVVGQDGHLDKVRAQHLCLAVLAALWRGFARRQDGHPTARLVELLDVDFLQVVERAADADRDLRWRVALIELEVRVDYNLVDAHWKKHKRMIGVSSSCGQGRKSGMLLRTLFVELNVDEVRLRSV